MKNKKSLFYITAKWNIIDIFIALYLATVAVVYLSHVLLSGPGREKIAKQYSSFGQTFAASEPTKVSQYYFIDMIVNFNYSGESRNQNLSNQEISLVNENDIYIKYVSLDKGLLLKEKSLLKKILNLSGFTATTKDPISYNLIMRVFVKNDSAGNLCYLGKPIEVGSVLKLKIGSYITNAKVLAIFLSGKVNY